jgi:predicted transcriptional regulator
MGGINMDELKLFDAEYKFMTLIWQNEPVNSTELVRLCEDKLGWKKSTTYTVLRKLRERNILDNRNAIVTSRVKQNEVMKHESEALLDKVFDNSLPRFLTAFLGDRSITPEEAEELKKIIDNSREDKR